MTEHASSVIEDLRDGGVVELRPIQAEDASAIGELFANLSAESSYNRFFHVRKPPEVPELHEFVDVEDSRVRAGIVAIQPRLGARLVGVANYVRVGEDRAEVAFAVADDHQGRGIGTLLLEQLAEVARANGISELVADVLRHNHRMLEVFSHSGFELRSMSGREVVRVVLATADDPKHALANALRRSRPGN